MEPHPYLKEVMVTRELRDRILAEYPTAEDYEKVIRTDLFDG